MKVGIVALKKPNLEEREYENLLKLIKSKEKKDPPMEDGNLF